MELPAEPQIALLRVLQDWEFRPIGASESSNVNVRVVAATNRDVAKQARPPAFGRVCALGPPGFELDLPPLRQR